MIHTEPDSYSLTYLCVNNNVVEPSASNDLQSCGVSHVADCDQVSKQPFHFAAVPPSFRIPETTDSY